MITATTGAVFPGADQSDADVIRQVLEGNTAMFELLMRRYNERIYRAARAIVRDEQEAETSCSRDISTRLRTCGSSMARPGFQRG